MGSGFRFAVRVYGFVSREAPVANTPYDIAVPYEKILACCGSGIRLGIREMYWLSYPM